MGNTNCCTDPHRHVESNIPEIPFYSADTDWETVTESKAKGGFETERLTSFGERLFMRNKLEKVTVNDFSIEGEVTKRVDESALSKEISVSLKTNNNRSAIQSQLNTSEAIFERKRKVHRKTKLSDAEEKHFHPPTKRLTTNTLTGRSVFQTGRIKKLSFRKDSSKTTGRNTKLTTKLSQIVKDEDTLI